jgi:protein SCO1/2
MARQQSLRRIAWTIASIAAACAIALTFDAAPLSAQNARWGADYFPNVPLTTHDGRTVRFYDDLIKGKIVAVDLIYTTCQYACPLETARLVQVQRVLGDRVGRDIFFYSITIDPEHDTPEVLAEYAQKYHVGPGWLFLTGKASDIELISRKLGLYSEPNPANPDGHTPMLLVGNETTGQWMRNSALDNPKFLARTIGDWLNSWENGAKQALRSFADVPMMTFDQGEYTFRNHCVACHSIGGGDAIGPDLKGVTANRDRAWLKRFIATPDKVLAAGDPIAQELLEKYKQVRMPNLALGEQDAAVLIDYIDRQSRGEVVAATKSDTPVATRPIADPRPLIDAYLGIQRALAADTLDGVPESAVALATETAKIGSAAATIKMTDNPFAEVEDLAAAREAFGPLSDAIIAYIGNALPDGVTVAYCPMARKSWLQRGRTIQNPYYGKAMAECGRITNDTKETKETKDPKAAK